MRRVQSGTGTEHATKVVIKRDRKESQRNGRLEKTMSETCKEKGGNDTKITTKPPSSGKEKGQQSVFALDLDEFLLHDTNTRHHTPEISETRRQRSR